MQDLTPQIFHWFLDFLMFPVWVCVCGICNMCLKFTKWKIPILGLACDWNFPWIYILPFLLEGFTEETGIRSPVAVWYISVKVETWYPEFLLYFLPVT